MDKVERDALVKTARQLERVLLRRRKAVVGLRELDELIRTLRQLIRDLTTPLPGDVYAPLAGEGHVPGTVSKAVLDQLRAGEGDDEGADRR